MVGPSEFMREEEEIKIEKTERPAPKEKPKVKVAKLNIAYVGEKVKGSSFDSELFDRSRLDDDEGVIILFFS